MASQCEGALHFMAVTVFNLICACMFSVLTEISGVKLAGRGLYDRSEIV